MFGEWQPIAVSTADGLVRDVEQIVRDLATEAEYERMRARIDTFVADNPVQTLLFTRESTIPITTEMLGPIGGGALAAVGDMAAEIRDLSARMSIYSELLPKQMRWQAALLLAGEADSLSLSQTVRDIGRNVAEMERISAFLDSLPGVISAERTAVMSDVTAERIAVMRELNAMLATTLEAVNGERIAGFFVVRTLARRTGGARV